MAARNATILSGFLHLLAIGLIILIGQRTPPILRPLHYQPVRLIAMPGQPSPESVKVEKPAPVKSATPKPKAVKSKPVSSKTESKTTEVKAETAGEQKTGEAEEAKPGGGGSPENIRLDGANFPYPYYLSNIQIKILSNFKPIIKAKEAQGLRAVTFFVIDRSGRIADVSLEKASGNFLFDQEAQRAVLRSNPLPALPPAFRSDHLGVHFEFIASE